MERISKSKTNYKLITVLCSSFFIVAVCTLMIFLPFDDIHMGKEKEAEAAAGTVKSTRPVLPDAADSQSETASQSNIDSSRIISDTLSDIKIVLKFGDSKETLDYKKISDWVYIEDGDTYFTVDTDKVREYTKSLSKKYDNYEAYITFKDVSGIEHTVDNRAIGWLFDDETAAQLLNGYIEKAESVTLDLTDNSEESRKWWLRTASDYDMADKLGDCCAFVSIQDQYMWIYKNGKVVLESPVITGNPNKGSDTPTGMYLIYQKKSPCELYGPGWSTEVKYWMAFNDDIGFHDAKWQDSFGGDTYLYNGSHGCVNLPSYVAEELYDIAYIDMPVYVY